jgi:tetratricopeptide (TPR) repeat protein
MAALHFVQKLGTMAQGYDQRARGMGQTLIQWVRRSVVGMMLAAALPALVQSADYAGPYLAGRVAGVQGDFGALAEFHARALSKDPQNVQILASLVQAYVALGQFDRAATVGKVLEAQGAVSQSARIAILASLAAKPDFTQIEARINDGKGVGSLINHLVGAWALYGMGEVQAARTALARPATDPAVAQISQLHLAYLHALDGDYDAALQVLDNTDGGNIVRDPRAALAKAQILSANGQGNAALDFASQWLGGTPVGQAFIRDLQSGARPEFTMLGSPRDAMAEVFFTIAAALADEDAGELALGFANAALHIRPDLTDAQLVQADILLKMDSPLRAAESFAKVPRQHPSFFQAELGRIEALIAADDIDGALQAYDGLTIDFAQNAQLWLAKGDLLRRENRFADAISAYNLAVSLQSADDGRAWYAYYVRGIARERAGQWGDAEQDLRKAIGLFPQNAHALNYLGYSLIIQDQNLDEALDLIRKAVNLAPNNGYILDSLAWGLYRLGQADAAVAYMEKAAEILPTDPVINDHLGDILWAVGRKREAHFHWRRALSFITDETDLNEVSPDNLRDKLQYGQRAELAPKPVVQKIPAPKARP